MTSRPRSRGQLAGEVERPLHARRPRSRARSQRAAGELLHLLERSCQWSSSAIVSAAPAACARARARTAGARSRSPARPRARASCVRSAPRKPMPTIATVWPRADRAAPEDVHRAAERLARDAASAGERPRQAHAASRRRRRRTRRRRAIGEERHAVALARRRARPRPTASTTPQPSWPGAPGAQRVRRTTAVPPRAGRFEAQTPQPSSRTRTSPGRPARARSCDRIFRGAATPRRASCACHARLARQAARDGSRPACTPRAGLGRARAGARPASRSSRATPSPDADARAPAGRLAGTRGCRRRSSAGRPVRQSPNATVAARAAQLARSGRAARAG